MRKASKILTLVLVAVLLLSVFVGCDIVGKDVYKYRNATVANVGDEAITVGKLLDTFNNYYNNYYYYLSSGALTVDQLFEMAFSALVQQYSQVDNYIQNHKSDVYSHSLSDFCHNAQYLTEDEMAYCIKYVKYLSFQTFDGNVEEKLAAKFDLKDAEEEDTSRDFTEYDEIGDSKTYAEYLYRQTFVNKDMDEYISKYYSHLDLATDGIDKYVYDNEQQAATRLEELNERVKGEDKISFADYQSAQNSVYKQYADSVNTTYGVEMSEFVVNQTADMVMSVITAKQTFESNSVLEGANIDETLATLTENLATLTNAQAAQFNISDNFDQFITSLSSTSFIYTVPDKFADDYVFVKNILIPFSDGQSSILTNLSNRLGTKEDDRYIAKRTEFAAQIVADDFLSDKDEDGEYAKVEDIFALDGEGNLIINPDGALGQYFGADGSVKPMEGKSADETIIELMKQYNTDVAQHTAQFDYVVRIGAPESYTHKWVDEFVDAAEVAVGLGKNSYALAISDYGVHIVYFVDYVKAQTFNFTKDNYLDSTSPEYRLFTTLYNSQISTISEEFTEELNKTYADKVTVTRVFKRFLKENEVTFDLQAFLDELRGDED